MLLLLISTVLALALLFPLTLASFWLAVRTRECYAWAHEHDFWLGEALFAPLFMASAAVLLPLDVSFNYTWGSVIFRELPPEHEWLFSDRVQRHYYGDNEVQRKRSVPWANLLNRIDAGHV